MVGCRSGKPVRTARATSYPSISSISMSSTNHQGVLRREGLDGGAAVIDDVDVGTELLEEHAETLGGVVVVIDDEDSRGWSEPRYHGPRAFGPLRPRDERETKEELAAPALAFAASLDGTTVHLGQPA